MPRLVLGALLAALTLPGCGSTPEPPDGAFTPVTTVVQGRAHVLTAPGATVPPDLLWEVARDAELGARAVDAVWGSGWGRSVTIVVGGAADLGEPSDRGLPAAAVTVPGGGTDGPGSSHVVVDAAVWSTLSRAGRRVVITHELVHVATDSVREPMPRWLEEGLADEVGWLGAGTPVVDAAREALEAAASGAPAALPADGAFDLAGPHAAVAYGQAYVAARLLAETYGEDGLVDVYRRAQAALAGSAADGAAAPDRALDQALRAVTGAGLTAFVASWRAELARLAVSTP